MPPASDRAQKVQKEADAQWLNYVNQGGGREPWHTPQVEWQYHDDFHEMEMGSPLGPIEKLRELLKLPKSESKVYWYPESDAVKLYQENHHMPATGKVTQQTWQSILSERGERQPAELKTQFEVPGTMTKPVPLTIRTKRLWMLALDDVPYRTYANQHNLALLAMLAYEKPEDLETRAREWNTARLREDAVFMSKTNQFRCFVREASDAFRHTIKSIEDRDSDTQVFVLDSPAYTVVAFRGTETDPLEGLRADAGTDLAAQGQRWMYDGTFENGKPAGKFGLRIHRGFGAAFDSIRDELHAALQSQLCKQPGKPVFITGHSLGAALSCLGACYVRSQPCFRDHPVQLYNYAQPRVGTLGFCQHYWRPSDDFSYYRIAHMFDTVTMVPSHHLAEDIITYRGLLDGFFGREIDLREFIPALYLAKHLPPGIVLGRQCPPELDYRHFGRLVLCGVDTQNHPFVEEIGKGEPQVIEPRGSGGVESVWRSNPMMHPMGVYLRYLMREFEVNARAFTSGQSARVALSAPPPLHASEASLFHRYVHSNGVPAYHSVEAYRSYYEAKAQQQSIDLR